MNTIFKHRVSIDKLNAKFLLVDKCEVYMPAKEMIEEITKEFEDKDGNFIRDFQTTGFDARLWELFLFKLFKDSSYEVLGDYGRPDFHLRKLQIDIFIEASTSNLKTDEIYTEKFIKKSIEQGNIEIQNEIVENYIIRLASVLKSKIDKAYWEHNWVKDKPLVLAISPFHNYIANFLPDSKIIEYLYGMSYETEVTDIGLELKDVNKVMLHKHFEKEISSNFFQLENVENISAVIFTNNCDIDKFNRMGLQNSKFDDILIVRSGIAYDSMNNSLGKEFDYVLKSGEITEKWNESVSIFHNPNAIHKIDKEFFSGFRQVWLNDKGGLDGEMQEFFVHCSFTECGIMK